VYRKSFKKLVMIVECQVTVQWRRPGGFGMLKKCKGNIVTGHGGRERSKGRGGVSERRRERKEERLPQPFQLMYLRTGIDCALQNVLSTRDRIITIYK
jgi:hypothetical protein